MWQCGGHPGARRAFTSKKQYLIYSWWHSLMTTLAIVVQLFFSLSEGLYDIRSSASRVAWNPGEETSTGLLPLKTRQKHSKFNLLSCKLIPSILYWYWSEGSSPLCKRDLPFVKSIENPSSLLSADNHCSAVLRTWVPSSQLNILNIFLWGLHAQWDLILKL